MSYGWQANLQSSAVHPEEGTTQAETTSLPSIYCGNGVGQTTAMVGYREEPGMIRRILFLALVAVFASVLVYAAKANERQRPTPLRSYAGVWRPVVPNSRFEQQYGDVARLEITTDGNNVVVRNWGWCNAIGPLECADAPGTAVAFSPSVTTAPVRDARAIVVTRPGSMLVVRLVDGTLVAETYRRYESTLSAPNRPYDYSVVDRLLKTTEVVTR